MAKFQMNVVLDPYRINKTARTADGAASSATQLNDADVGKFLKLVGDSQMGLCAVGDEIEAVLETANEMAQQDGFNIGGYRANHGDRVKVTLDGLQATPGVGVINVGDYVVTGTVVARNTTLGGAYPKVCKATAAPSAMIFKWRVVALMGTNAVGQTAVIERV